MNQWQTEYLAIIKLFARELQPTDDPIVRDVGRIVLRALRRFFPPVARDVRALITSTADAKAVIATSYVNETRFRDLLLFLYANSWLPNGENRSLVLPTDSAWLQTNFPFAAAVLAADVAEFGTADSFSQEQKCAVNRRMAANADAAADGRSCCA